jgi:hypothetical protein
MDEFFHYTNERLMVTFYTHIVTIDILVKVFAANSLVIL